jgi:hypothetical protein
LYRVVADAIVVLTVFEGPATTHKILSPAKNLKRRPCPTCPRGSLTRESSVTADTPSRFSADLEGRDAPCQGQGSLS